MDVARLAVGKWRWNARHQTAGPQVDVLVEPAPPLNERAPKRYVIGYRRRPADGAEKNRLVSMDLFEPVFRHHSAVFDVVIAAPRELVPLECDAELLTRGLERANALGDELLADAFTWDDGDAMRFCHGRHHNEAQKRSIATAA